MTVCLVFLNLGTPRRRRFAGAERGSRVLQGLLSHLCGRVRAAEHAPHDPFRVLERRHGLAEIVERGAVVLVERSRGRTDYSILLYSARIAARRGPVGRRRRGRL